MGNFGSHNCWVIMATFLAEFKNYFGDSSHRRIEYIGSIYLRAQVQIFVVAELPVGWTARRLDGFVNITPLEASTTQPKLRWT